MHDVIVAQTLKGGRAPAELASWPGRLLDDLPAWASIRVLLVAVVIVLVGVIVAWLARIGPAPGSPAPHPNRQPATKETLSRRRRAT